MTTISSGTPATLANITVISSGGNVTDWGAEFDMVPFSEFHPLILPHAATCPRPVIDQHLRLALIQFCERTRLWRYVANMTINERAPCLVAPEFTTVHEIETAWWNETVPLEPVQFTEVEPSDLISATGQPQAITTPELNQVQVIPFEPGRLRLTLAVRPRSDVEFRMVGGQPRQDIYNRCPRALLVNYGEPIAHVALGRILALPGNSFTSFDLAAYFRGMGEQKMDELSGMKARGQHRARRKVRASWF